MTSDRLISSAPVAVSQRLIELSTGKATSRTPSCNGTTRFINPMTSGIATKKILIVVLRRQVSLCAAHRDCLLRAHHDRVAKSAQQHDQAEHHVHDANALVVHAGQPLAPQIWPPALHSDGHEDSQNNDADHRSAEQREWLVEGNCCPAQPSQHVNLAPDAAADATPHRCSPFLNLTPSARGCARTALVPPSDRSWAALPCSALPVRRSRHRPGKIRCRASA